MLNQTRKNARKFRCPPQAIPKLHSSSGMRLLPTGNNFVRWGIKIKSNRKEAAMQKVLLSIVALAALTVAVPYVSTAQADQTVVIKRHHNRYFDYAPRHDKTVIIKHHHEHDEY
jgi:hypothetical protein